ncbi:hypothetical protein SCH01S_21_01130 [Sphingomonas changbaiensis NBRC 104936]|uniref:FecR protein domain-containing protein n=2 Tax=Sphingomonas changbaiensis TaxID=529705 RepID=A0A0E9MND9_9SPHN|nr:hypothetical protein SCH01S_21_01130 [Sphingomonas changbaiensis NBRC 104936]
MTHFRLTALALATVASSPLMANDLDWRISEASGNVQLLHAGLSKVAARGGLVEPGDTIVTGRGARAVVTRGEEYLMVAPSSQLRLPAAEQSGAVTKIFQDFGNVVFMIKKKMTPHFSVSTPYLAAVVKGTTFSVSVTDTGTSVQVIEGAVDVATADGGAHDLLKPGAVAMVNAMDRFRLRIEGDGAARTITSPAIPAAGTTPQLPPAPSAPATVAPAPTVTANAAPRQDVITTAIFEKPVSLAETTGGLVNGTIGDDVQAQFAMVGEGSHAAADTIHAAAASVAATEVASHAETARMEASATVADASAAAKAAEQAASVAEQSNKAAADAAAAKAASDAASAAAAAKANEAAQLARAAAAEAAHAADETAARQAQEAAAMAAAAEAQRAADAAKQNALDAAAIDAANKAAKEAAEQAQRASDQAAQAEADRVAREAARQDAQKQAEQTAKDAAKAAQEAMDRSAEKAARDAAKAADDAAREQAKQLADAAKAAEKAASDAADRAAKEAEKAAKDAEKAAQDAMKVDTPVDMAGDPRGNGPGSPPDKGNNGQGKSGKDAGPLDNLKDVLSSQGKGGKGKN